MNQLFLSAVPLLDKALEREPRLTPACHALAEIGRQSSDALQKGALAQCLSANPASYNVVWEWMIGSMPKWGGSLREMNKVGAYVVQHGPENPTLYSLLVEPPGYEAAQLDTYAGGLEGFVAASRAGPGARMMTNAGRAHWDKDDPWMALVYFSQALRFWQGAQEVRMLRGLVLNELGDYAWALEDLLPSAAEDSENLEVQYAIGNSLLSLNRIEESRPYLLRAQKLPTREFAALERYCFTYAYKYESVSTKQARDCTAALVKHNPSHGLYWMWRYQALSAARDERWVEAAGQFLLYADPDNPWQQSLKKDLLASGVQPARSSGVKRAKP
jgi:tetratricopeptide (TPR) repeat protein